MDDVVTFRIGLSEHVSENDGPINVNLVVAFVVLADDVGRPMDALTPLVTVQGQIHQGFEKRKAVPLILKKGEPIRGEARVGVHPAWKTKWEISVERRSA